MNGMLQTNVTDLQNQAVNTLGLIDQHEKEVRVLFRKITRLKAYHTDLTCLIEFAEQLLRPENQNTELKATGDTTAGSKGDPISPSRKTSKRIPKKTWHKLVKAMPMDPNEGLTLKQIWQLARRRKIFVTQHAVYMRLVRFEEEGLVSRTFQPKKQRWHRSSNNVINLQTNRK